MLEYITEVSAPDASRFSNRNEYIHKFEAKIGTARIVMEVGGGVGGDPNTANGQKAWHSVYSVLRTGQEES